MTSDSLDQPLAVVRRADRVPLGILYMIAATVLFAGSTALSKWQVATYPFSEVLLFRAAVSLITCALLIMPRTGWSVFRTQRLGQHAARSVTQTVAQSCILIALSLMPLAGAMAINFSAPLFATLFAAFWLKERVELARGAALVIGFFGVLLVASPGADTFRLGALFAIANAVMFGSVTAAVRGMTNTESAETLTIWAMILGYLFWGDIPTLALLAGSSIVVGSGLFLLWRESGKKPLPAD